MGKTPVLALAEDEAYLRKLDQDSHRQRQGMDNFHPVQE
jgi:hypothetical protein